MYLSIDAVLGTRFLLQEHRGEQGIRPPRTQGLGEASQALFPRSLGLLDFPRSFSSKIQKSDVKRKKSWALPAEWAHPLSV